jgi:methyl-accepting chemotaxis protein
VTIGVRQRLIILIFSGLFVTMGLIGTYRYFMEKRDLVATARGHGEQSCKLMAELAAPYLLTSDFGGLHAMVQDFMHTPDAQEVVIIDREGRQLARSAKPSLSAKRIMIGPLPVASGETLLGEVRIAVYPADMDRKLRAYAVSTVIEHLFIFFTLAGILSFSATRIITSPVKELGGALKEITDRKDFTRRVAACRNDEIGELAAGVNCLIERVEQFVVDTGAVSARISELSPTIAADTHEVRKNAEVEEAAITNASSSVAQMSSSIQDIAESAESLTVSAEETSSAILEMNASNQEVALHTAELTSSVEDVTTSVMEMIASIREVASHVDSLTSAAEGLGVGH